MFSKKLHWFIYPIFLLSCAKQGAPTGGPKDTIPPALVKAIPANEATDVSPKSIELEFSEMVDASTAKDQLIITPSLGKNFDVRTKKNSVIVDLKKSLDENTTYHLNFRESIKDVTERNPAKQLQLAFSTGPYLDSLSISGSISNLLKGTPVKEGTVALHIQNDTFSILKHPATILTKTDDKGNFKIDYLKPGYYYIYAFDDKNKNLFVDSRTEPYSFEAYPIKLENDTSKINLGLINLDTRPLKLTSARPYNTYFNVRATKNISEFEFQAPKEKNLYASFADDRANIKIYSTQHSADSVQFSLSMSDSVGNKIDTTLYAKFLTSEVTPEKFTMEITESSLVAARGLLNVKLTFNKPISHINFDSLYYQIDSAHITKITFSDLTWNLHENILNIAKTLDRSLLLKSTEEEPVQNSPQPPAPSKTQATPKTQKKSPSKAAISNQLIIGKATFISVDRDSSKRMQEPIAPQQPDQLSEIIYTIKTIYPHVLIQLLDKDYKLLSQQSNQKGSFTELKEGTYLLRAVIDENNNGRWDAGSYLSNKPPEKVFYYRGGPKNEMIIQLKSNWELELAPLLTTY